MTRLKLPKNTMDTSYIKLLLSLQTLQRIKSIFTNAATKRYPTYNMIKITILHLKVDRVLNLKINVLKRRKSTK